MLSTITKEAQEALKGSKCVSTIVRFVHLVGCLLVFSLYWRLQTISTYPLTSDFALSAAISELNRYQNYRRRKALLSSHKHRKSDSSNDSFAPQRTIQHKKAKKASGAMDMISYMAAIVGYREQPLLFQQALRSYKQLKSCRFLLVGIDGDAPEDKEMQLVFNKVYPSKSATIHLPIPLGRVAEQVLDACPNAEKHDKEATKRHRNEKALSYCCQIAREALHNHGIVLSGPGAISRLCIYQPHLNKKSIMFTTFIFSIVISEILQIQYLWNSDSDSIVFPETISGTISLIAGDPAVGGSSCGLAVHNPDETLVTRLGSIVYWAEFHFNKTLAASTGDCDVQSGPAAAFRVCALSEVLMRWYMQTVWGHRMITNEDRHITLNLLWYGWDVTYASDVLIATYMAPSFKHWISQQIRWARCQHVEALHNPQIYFLRGPMFFLSAYKREIGPIAVSIPIMVYLFTGKSEMMPSLHDIGLRIICTMLYNIYFNVQRMPLSTWILILPALLLSNIPQPGPHVWALLTPFDDSWSATTKGRPESKQFLSMNQERIHQMWFVVLWLGCVGGSLGRGVASFLGQSQYSWGTQAGIWTGFVLTSTVSGWLLIKTD